MNIPAASEERALWRLCVQSSTTASTDEYRTTTGRPMHRSTCERPMSPCWYAHSGALSSAQIATG
jgi:hypothetical protein